MPQNWCSSAATRSMVGQISVPDDFDRMGKDEIEEMFGGGA
jgi:hypothetical protein